MTRTALICFLLSVQITTGQPKDLSPWLKKHKPEHAPALAAAIIIDGKIAYTGVTGVRVMGKPEHAKITDKFHCGSCGKSMTATLAAHFVESGKIKWTTTVAEILKDYDLHPDYQKVTLKQLLSNTGGVHASPTEHAWNEGWKVAATKTPINQRKHFLKLCLTRKLAHEPGTKGLYSNTGFALAGHMLEVIGGQPYEALMQKHLFHPLNIHSAGFGTQAPPNDPNQPWPHDAQNKPVLPSGYADNPAAITPAGTVHMSVPDVARYLQMHLLSQTGPVIKQKETYKNLHTIVIPDYALGWSVLHRDWAKGRVLNHSGSNTMNFMTYTISPKQKFGFVLATNTPYQPVLKQFDPLTTQLLKDFLPSKN